MVEGIYISIFNPSVFSGTLSREKEIISDNKIANFSEIKNCLIHYKQFD